MLPVYEVLSGHNFEEMGGNDMDYTMKILTCGEHDFPLLHDNIIKKQSAKFSGSAQNNFSK